MELLETKNSISVVKLAEYLHVSHPTIRRDLSDLEEQGKVHRTHGGVVLRRTSEAEIPLIFREDQNNAAKQIIAQKAAPLIHDGDVIFLDASSSAFNMIPYILDKKDITVITNGIKAINALCEYKDHSVRTISTGGSVHMTCLALVGEDAFRTIEQYNADVCFFACRGLSEDGCLTDIAPDEDYVRLKMIEHSKKSYLLCTAEKIGKVYYHNICHIERIDGAIFGSSPCDALKEYEIKF